MGRRTETDEDGNDDNDSKGDPERHAPILPLVFF